MFILYATVAATFSIWNIIQIPTKVDVRPLVFATEAECKAAQHALEVGLYDAAFDMARHHRLSVTAGVKGECRPIVTS